MKRVQNRVAESRYALPLVAAYALGVWGACGLLQQQWWVHLACFSLSAFLVVVLSTINALIRIYSRMVSCVFLVLSCTACFLFDSMGGAIVQLCFITSYITLFHCYQDKQTPGWMYYTFLCIGLASTLCVQILYFVPFLWLLAELQLNAMSWRSFTASLLGLLTPYWFAAGWLVWQGNVTPLKSHFSNLIQFQKLCDYSQVTLSQVLVFALVVVLAIIGTIHFWYRSYNDKIRTRQLYGFFTIMDLLTTIFLLLQPQHYDVLIRVLIINSAPLIAHFIALTHTKLTNIAFYVISMVCLLLTAYNVWMSSSIF